MSLQNSDLFLINSSSDNLNSYTVEAAGLQTASGIVLVNRNNTSYQCEASKLANKLQPNDKLLVNRDGTSYQVSGAEVLDFFTPPSGLIYGLNWSGSNTAAGSSAINENTFYDGNANNGVVFTPKAGGLYETPYLRIDFVGRWKVTKVIYGAWTSQIANGNWNNLQYSASRGATSTLKQNGGTGNTSGTVNKSPSIEQELPFLMTGADKWTNSIDLYQQNATPGAMAVAKFEIYGYEVDRDGDPI